MNIFVTIPQGPIRDSFITENAKKVLETLGQLTFNEFDRQLTHEELLSKIKDVDVLITGWGTTPINSEIIESAKNLKIIAHTGGSVGYIIENVVYEKGIRVLSGNNVFAQSVAEGCLCYTLSGLRQIEKYVNIVRSGKWREDDFKNKGIIGKKVGIVGFGAIAKYFVEMLHLFGTEILVYSGHLTKDDEENLGVRRSSLNEIFETCDVISLHSSLTAKTEGMINKDLLSKIKDGALLVNTARGALIDEEALIEELKTGRFSAVLDVFKEEPLKVDSPLRTLPNVLPIPHMGGPTIDMREQVVLTLADDLKSFLENKDMKNEIPYEYASRMTSK